MNNLFAPLWLSVQLAAMTTILLLVIATPIAWWLANSDSRWKPLVQTVVAMPIVLPPTVMGFYLLILLGPAGTLGSWWVDLTGNALTFTLPVSSSRRAFTVCRSLYSL